MRNIDARALKRLVEREGAVLVCVLDRRDFERKHICGSINIPLEEIETIAPKLIPRDEMVVLYCAGPECGASLRAAEKLAAMGYTDVMRFAGGIEVWKRLGFCLDGSETRKAA